ncbi:FAD-binding protein [Mycobacterium tuberculosis]|nr:FAD-binding protein [Mycobacterium tuberculosis]
MSAATDLYAVHQALAGESRAIPTGSCPTVGVAGLTLGGGLGADSRHAGLTCDALKSATVVLPGGDAVSASADDHAELFWALRGGRGGNFGVTTSMTFARFPTADCDVVRVDFAPSAAAQVLGPLAILEVAGLAECRDGRWRILRAGAGQAAAKGAAARLV